MAVAAMKNKHRPEAAKNSSRKQDGESIVVLRKCSLMFNQNGDKAALV